VFKDAGGGHESQGGDDCGGFCGRKSVNAGKNGDGWTADSGRVVAGLHGGGWLRDIPEFCDVSE
jgi:hypothetical protein